MLNIEYVVNPQKKKVICKIHNISYRKPIIGMAKCGQNDQFDEEIGKQIAYRRAMIALKEYDKQDAGFTLGHYKNRVKHYESVIKKADKRIREMYDEIRVIINKQYEK